MDSLRRLAVLGGRLLSSTGFRDGVILIEDERIAGIVPSLPESYSGEIVDATGKWVMAGAIDTQVHFREPGLTHKEDIESGTRAAIMGGVTTIFEMPNTDPVTTSPESLSDKLGRAGGRAWCDYSFFVGASAENVGRLAELEMLPGTPGIKIFMGSSTGPLLVGDDSTLEAVLRDGSRPCPAHAEDEARNRERKGLLSPTPHPREHPFLRDAESARLATERLIGLCRKTGRPVHILHVSTRDELPLIRAAKAEGLPVTCEVTPQHLSFDARDYETLGTLVQMNPPIRSAEHREALWEAVAEGLFDVFGSDHAPHTREEKAKPYPQSPSGMPGVQTLLPVLFDHALNGRLKLEQLPQMLCERPASLYGITGKGRLGPGYDADLVILDPAASWTVRDEDMESKCGWTPYAGRTLRGKIDMVFLRGLALVRGGVRSSRPSGEPVRFGWKRPVE